MARHLNKLFLLVILVGIGLIIAGVSVKAVDNKFFADAEKGVALIVEMKDDNFLSRRQSVYVRYMVGHDEYREELGSFDESMKLGGSVNILYSPSDPTDIRWENYQGINKKLVSAGLLTALFTLILFLWRNISMYNYRRRRAQEREYR